MTEAARAALAEHSALVQRIDELLPAVDELARLMIETYESGRRVYTFGNGGSAADAQHFAAELVGRYRRERAPLPASALSVDPSVVTCIANDYAFDELFARQVQALARRGDVVIGFTTSGRSPNVVRGLAAAREAGARTVLFSGDGGGDAAAQADHALLVPSTTTARIQELHLLLVHLVIDQVDAWAETATPAGEMRGRDAT
jgi:D-sedoheptulose 7-phosphate isomerase